MRFPKSVSDNFNFDKLKDFDDLTKKNKTSYKDQDDGPVDIFDCFRNMSEPEQLEPGNEWYCSNCKEHKLATKQMSIYRSPKVLILHFKIQLLELVGMFLSVHVAHPYTKEKWWT